MIPRLLDLDANEKKLKWKIMLGPNRAGPNVTAQPCRPNRDGPTERFLDESPDRPRDASGAAFWAPVRDAIETLHEVCRVIGGVPKCSCPINYERDSTSRACTVIDECQFPQSERTATPSSVMLGLSPGLHLPSARKAASATLSPTKEKPGRVCPGKTAISAMCVKVASKIVRPERSWPTVTNRCVNDMRTVRTQIHATKMP
ncbi:hypothetical protein niasHT_038943 [Heterodera trifolii]|uniref:Uncharacterized protein n=1 Tax=Heterodera trifolii TaxID=157864 RepID=A0ABD2HNP1_9BILA